MREERKCPRFLHSQSTMKEFLNVRISVIVGLWLSLLFLNDTRANALQTELYSEQGYLLQDETPISSLRVRELIPLGLGFRPFLQLGSEGTSFFYYGPGVSWGFKGLRTVLEWRERGYYQPSSSAVRDLRASIIFNQQWLSELFKHWSSYQELYSEGVLSSAEGNNTIFSGWVRSGIRQTQWSPLVFDLFLEPFGSGDTLGRKDNRRIELRPSVRAQYQFSRFYLGLSGAYVIPIYGKTQIDGSWLDRKSGIRVLAVLGGEVG